MAFQQLPNEKREQVIGEIDARWRSQSEILGASPVSAPSLPGGALSRRAA